ncbi:MAG: ABC transporter substrate-binding protein [Acidobacteria bacterium]|nr:ABC transporter substrate-binding protein [Acidobacteriota bacterium]
MRTVRALTTAVAVAAALSACTAPATGARTKGEVALKIGLLYTTAGRGGDFASAALGAATIAAKSAAAAGVKIEILEADYAGEIGTIPAAAKALAAKSDAIVVATDDGDVAPQLDAVGDRPVVHALITTDGILEGRRNVFRVAPTDELEATRIATYLAGTRKYSKVAVLTDTTAFGERGATDLAAAFARAGITPVVSRSFTPGGDIHTPVMEAGQREAQALVVWADSPTEAARIVVEAHRMGQSYQIALSGNLATATFAKNASAQVTPVAFRDGMLSVGTWAGPWFDLDRIKSFYSEFQAANSAFAPVQAASVYDAILALARAARARGTAPDDLISGLEGLEDFEAAGVPVSFGVDRHEGIDPDDLAVLAFTKNQDSPGGDFAPEVDTGGGFFTVLPDSLDLPERYRFLTEKV